MSGNKRSYSHIKLTYVTHFYCNQKTTDSVIQLLTKYASYPKELLDRIHFVIVDDGSPIEYEIPDLPLNLTWLKVKKDIRWNQAGARNLGVLYAKSDSVIATDLDHEFPESTLEKLLKLKSIGKRLYKFWRKNPENNTWKKGHPNIFLFSRGRFFELFGYDEEFAGNYGAEDFRFVKFHKDQGTIHVHLPKKYFCIERQDIDRKRSYHSLNRDLSFNTPVDARKKLEFQWYGHGYGHSRSSFNFEHEVLREYWREPPPPSIDKSWKRRYLLRTLLPKGW
ncbi:glycosyltransferase group 2 [Hahella sp. CCB-MM4]|nr:glycosyltransferase group 2 [Hahella sp. CCB-MM4]